MTKNQFNQTGRSMVEMLGVLAIIGVLSVGGISSYTMAMNKHRANELLNEASKRAAVIAMQITAGKTGGDLSIAEFTNPSGYSFGVASGYAAGGKTFSLTLNKDAGGNIDETICTQMKAALGDNAAMAVNDDCTTLTFNADMSKGVDASDTNDSNDNKGNECVDTCGNDAKCVNGYCECLDGSVWDPSGIGTGSCAAIRGDCTKNSDCEEGEEYCHIYGEGSPFLTTGTCKAIGSPQIREYLVGENAKIFLRSENADMTWWAARNWCLANNMNMITLSDLGITGGYESGYCSGTNCLCGEKACTDEFWNGLLESSVLVWTASNHGSDNYTVNMSEKSVGYAGYRNFNDYYALCK